MKGRTSDDKRLPVHLIVLASLPGASSISRPIPLWKMAKRPYIPWKSYQRILKIVWPLQIVLEDPNAETTTTIFLQVVKLKGWTKINNNLLHALCPLLHLSTSICYHITNQEQSSSSTQRSRKSFKED